MPDAEILPFRPPFHPDARTLVAPDGRKWCARAYIDSAKLFMLTHGKDYTPHELVRIYGMLVRNGEPGLYLYEGEELPETVRYEVEPLCIGEV